jgi:hypothetical protein
VSKIKELFVNINKLVTSSFHIFIDNLVIATGFIVFKYYENTTPIRSMRTGKSTKQPDIEFKELFNFFKELNTLKETNEPENTLNIDPTITAELNENINSHIMTGY